MINFKSILILPFVFIALSGCSSMNSKFSCNMTAGDGCMTMEDINALTEGRKPQRPVERITKEKQRFIKAETKRIWVAPWTDDKGISHQGKLVYIPSVKSEDLA